MGFVSNSSGTSFIIFGVFCDQEEWVKKILEFADKEKVEKELEKCFVNLMDLMDYENEEQIEEIKEIKALSIEEKIEYIIEQDYDDILDTIQNWSEDAGFYRFEYGGDSMFWFGVDINTCQTDNYSLKDICEQIESAKEIAKKYGFDENRVEMGSVFENQ